MEPEEIEIKIEYNESYEIDPLRDDSYMSKENVKLNNQNSCETNSISNDDQMETISQSTQETHTWYQSKDSNGKLICKYCDLKYSTIQTLRHHMKTKHPENAMKLKKLIYNNRRNRKHVCHICKLSFINISELESHVTLDHSVELIQKSCEYCIATFNSVDEVIEHVYIKHQKEKAVYTCNICGYRTYKKSHYKQHQNVHVDNKSMVCQYCDYRTNYLPNLRIHERIHINERPYSCNFEECGYRCTAKSALRSHQLKHYPDENMLFCDKCNYRTVYKQSLQKHLDSHRRDVIRIKVNNPYIVKPITTFNSVDEVIEHVYIKHQKEKAVYTCNICGYRTYKKSHYKQHQNVHVDNKSMVCQYCDYRTNYLPNLRIHERIHTNERLYSCNFEECGYRCTAKSALRSHQLKHYPDKNMLFCDKCNYRTVYKQSLQKHLDSHRRDVIRIKV